MSFSKFYFNTCTQSKIVSCCIDRKPLECHHQNAHHNKSIKFYLLSTLIKYIKILNVNRKKCCDIKFYLTCSCCKYLVLIAVLLKKYNTLV